MAENTPREIEWAQKIAVLEYKVSQLGESLSKHAEESQKRDQTIEEKLDGLLELRDKGMGAFWLVSAIVGSGFVAGIVWIVSLMKGNPV